MKLFYKLCTLSLLPFVLGCSDSLQELTESLKLKESPKGLTVTKHLSASMGPDHFKLWQMAPLADDAFKNLLQQANASLVVKRSMSGCLGLENSDSAPAWWPAKDLEDASWDYTSSPYELFTANPTTQDHACIFRNSKTKITYVQVFDT